MTTEEAKTAANFLEYAQNCFSIDGTAFNLVHFRDGGQRQLREVLVQKGEPVLCDLLHLAKETDRETISNSLLTLCEATSMGPTYLIAEHRRATFRDIRVSIQTILSLIEDFVRTAKNETKSIRKITIFYSWQSDSVHEDNMTFIGGALEEACGELQKRTSKSVKFEIDRDTLGEPGSPDIFNTVRDKISRCAVFVCDLTPIVVFNHKAIPNPNVMIELGYALSSLTDSRIIMVLNTDSESFSKGKMPFDLQTKRFCTYSFPEDKSRSDVKNELVECLVRTIETILKNDSSIEAF